MGIELLQFKNKHHKDAFWEMIEAMYLSEEELHYPSSLIKKQIAFSYLIALYQEDYRTHEGEAFYIEIGAELSLGGPIYLLDERYGERKADYEKIVPIACRILREENIQRIIDEEKLILSSFKTPIKDIIGYLLSYMQNE